MIKISKTNSINITQKDKYLSVYLNSNQWTWLPPTPQGCINQLSILPSEGSDVILYLGGEHSKQYVNAAKRCKVLA